MGWFGLFDHENAFFERDNLRQPGQPRPDPASLLVRGSLMIETRLSPGRRPQTLILFTGQGELPMRLSLQSIPSGAIVLVLDQGGAITHCSLQLPHTSRLDILRIIYSWDSVARTGQMALECTSSEKVVLEPITAPRPIRLADLCALLEPGLDQYVSPDVLYIAVSDELQPVGPMPTLAPTTPIATPAGYVPAGSLKRGDLVLTDSGQTAPVLHSVTCTVPARGFFRPVRLRAPYFGLQQDIVVAPSQQMVISGSVVDYMFGTEAVLVSARHLIGGTAAARDDCGPFTTYTQVLLPGHEALIAAGTAIESLYIGRIRRNKTGLAASLLANLDRSGLPEHGKSVYPSLRPFDALVLAEQRAA